MGSYLYLVCELCFLLSIKLHDPIQYIHTKDRYIHHHRVLTKVTLFKTSKREGGLSLSITMLGLMCW